ncbi:MAG: DUF222 domain-containing protein [Acidimicrobiales bacterium]|nr:DUF222 domain-containing protein [Acidimicrobiales bacterium]
MIPADRIGGDGELDDPFGSIDALVAADPTSMTDEEARRHVLALHRAKARVDAAVIAATGVVDGRGLHRADGSRSAGAWLSGRVDQTRGRSHADVRLSRFLRDAPATAAAFRAGRIGRVKVDLLARTRTPEVASIFTTTESHLVDTVETMLVADADTYLSAWHERALEAAGYVDPDHPTPPAAPFIALHLDQTVHDRWVLAGEMDNDHGQRIKAAIEAELDHLFRSGALTADDGLSVAERRGVALARILDRQVRAGTRHGRPRPSIEVRVDARTLAGIAVADPADDDGADLASRVSEYLDGSPLAPTTLARYLCHADLHRVVMGPDGEILDVGKRHRSATRAQRRALRNRHDGHCAYPGCHAPDDWCEAHHIVPWNPDPASPDGGTDLSNLVPLCDFHHHRVHALGLGLTLHPDGTLDVHRPVAEGRRRQPITPTLDHRRWRPPPRSAPAA